jgi:serine-type D-Ala-D-Ala endopeptidase (penicillin-binding protein 7)
MFVQIVKNRSSNFKAYSAALLGALLLALSFGSAQAAQKKTAKAAPKAVAAKSHKAERVQAVSKAAKPTKTLRAEKTSAQKLAGKAGSKKMQLAAADRADLRASKRVGKAGKHAATRVARADMVVVKIRGKNGKIIRVARASAPQPRAGIIRVAHTPRPSFGQLAGLHGMQDELELKSSVALVVDQDSNEVLFSKNEDAVLPIASITKLMTALVISDAKLNMNEHITVTDDDVDVTKGSRSRLAVGTELTRAELLHLALMSSENRAAHALGRSYPGGLDDFVRAMNAKAKLLGMKDSRFVEPTGLSSRNQSSAYDLAQLVDAAYQHPKLREYSTSAGTLVPVGEKLVQYNNTNRLVSHPEWDIGLQKTGFISEAGQCLVMQAKVAGRKLIMVFLDSAGKLSRIGDAERVRKWVQDNANTQPAATPAAAPQKVSARMGTIKNSRNG